MPKNVIIFSDGTGQAGGLIPDELRSNIYKLYRATRCGTDTNIDPKRQVAFYDPGLGSQSDNGRLKISLWRRIRNFFAQTTGLGITENIVDCYAAILYLWRPGDRIFLLGFSRGAYTVRCLGGVLSLCGVPTTMEDGKTPLRRDPKSLRRIARDAVRNVYLHGNARFDPEFKLKLEDQRKELAKNFRVRHNSNHTTEIDRSNEVPYFIGVFDTVAALGAKWQIKVATGLGIVLGLLAIAFLIAAARWHYWTYPFWSTFWSTTSAIFVVALLLGSALYLLTHVKVATDLKGYHWWDRWHFTGWKTQFYDTQLNLNVGWARHALSIDENRKDFAVVPWGLKGAWRRVQDGEPTWFKQFWFPGNHSDIGGSYAENESRLSDIALKWMVDEAKELPHGLIVDERFLHLSPDPSGVQHDECKARIPFWFWTLRWPVGYRKPVEEATLHPSVLERFECSDGVLHYDEVRLYRPEILKRHIELARFFQPDGKDSASVVG